MSVWYVDTDLGPVTLDGATIVDAGPLDELVGRDVGQVWPHLHGATDAESAARLIRAAA